MLLKVLQIPNRIKNQKGEFEMSSKMGRRFLAGALAGIVSFTTLGMNCTTVLAEETSECLEASVNTDMLTDTSKDVLYRFVPETTGKYEFYSVESGDTYGCIYDAEQNVLYSDNDGGEELNFSITAELKANTEYYLGVSYFEIGAEGEIAWKIEKVVAEEATLTAEETPEGTEAGTTETTEVVTEGSDTVESTEAATESDGITETETKTTTTENPVEGEYEYTEKDGIVTITKYTGTEEVVSIPEKINGKTVGVIGTESFMDSDTLKEVTIPKTVTEIQYAAFMSCRSLKTLNFAPDSTLQKIARKSFAWCSSLEAVSLPDSLKEAGTETFYSCTSLVKVDLGKGLTKVSDYMFSETSSLKNITFPSNITTIGYGAFSSSGLVSLTIPDTVTTVEASAFAWCNSLSEVKLGAGIEGISDNVFSGTTSLKTITFPANITYIGKNAFYESGLESVDIPSTVTSVGEYAFANCHNLRKAELGSGLTYVAEGTFYNSELETVKIGENIKSLGLFSFSRNDFKEITIPDTVVELEYGVFLNCQELGTVNLPDDLEKIGGHCFHYTKWFENQKDGDVYAGNVYYYYKGEMPANTTVTIKDGTLGIAGWALEEQENLTALHIPYGVTNIGEFALIGCTSLNEVTIPSSVTEIWDYSIGYEYGWDEGYVKVPTTFGGNAYCVKIPDFTIIGDADSEAEAYAQKHGFSFKKNVYTVNFYDGDKLVSTQQVISGESAEAPALTKDGYLLSWDTDFSNVKRSLNVKAVWKDYAEVSLPENNTLTKEKFAEVLEMNKNFDVVVKSNNNVTFTFAKGTMKAVSGKESYDFTTTIYNTYSTELPAFVTADNFVLKIDYAYSGQLPAEASIRIFVGTEYAGKTLYYSWLKEDGTLAEVQGSGVGEDGYMMVKQDHCSSYVITTESPATTVKSPGTGDVSMMGIYMVMALSAVVMVFVTGKKYNK